MQEGLNVFPFQGTDRFVHPQCLGSGSFGSVYEVFDRERQSRVALKIPHETTAKGLFLFKKEFRALADVCHPNLVSLHELISDRDQWFFTMELIEGIDLLRFLRSRWNSSDHPNALGIEPDSDPGGNHPIATAPEDPTLEESIRPPEALEPDDDELLPVSPPSDFRLVARTFKQLAHGLMAIHQAGLLHKDIKPSNVLVSAEGRVVLLDFGLSSEIDSVEQGDGDASEIAGTPAYMAPEQLLDNRCTESSDWYSVGVLLYHVLTGRLPFQGKGLRVLVNKVSQIPAPPRRLVSEIPPDLNDLCMDLLRPRPDERPTGFEFLRRLEHSETATSTPPSRKDFVGRASELEMLIQAFKSLVDGHAGWVNLHGGSGMGKSFLVRKFQREIQKLAPEALVLSGRCYEQEHVPYKALDGLVDELSQYLKRLPAARAEALLPRHTYALAQLFPVLRQVPRIAETQKRFALIADPQELRHRAFAALRELLWRIGEDRPLVLIIDDLHWGDTDSAILLTDLLSPPDAPLMLFVACYRTEESSTSSVLRDFLALSRASLNRCTEVPLKEFAPDQAFRLAVSLLGDLGPTTEDLATWVVQESGGNPFFIQELAQHAHTLQAPDLSFDNLESFIQTRVAELPAEARRILELCALAGYPLDWHIIREAAEVETGGVESLDSLRQGHLIRIRSTDKHRMIEPYHDFIRRSVAESLTILQARERHLRLAQVLETAPQPDVQALALHFKAAGEVGKAVDYLTTAGLQASASLAFAKAASLLRMSLSLRSPDDPGSGPIWKHLGEVLSNAGRGKEAAEAYLEAVKQAEPREANQFRRLAALEFLRNGHFQEGTAVLEGVLSAIGDRLATSQTQAILSALYRKLLIRLRGLHFKERNPQEIPQSTLDRLDAYWVITTGLATGDLMRVADFQARQLLLSLQAGDPVRLVRALSYEAIFSTSRGNRSERMTQKYLDLAMMHAERIGDPNSMSQALIACGIAHTAMGRWRKGAEILDRVEMKLRENATGLTYELRNAQSYALINHYALGNLAVLSERLPSLVRDAKETGDLLFLANLKTGSAFIHYLARNEPELARTNIRQIMGKLPDEGFFYQRYLELAALANISLYDGSIQEAWAFMTERWKALHRSHLMVVQAIRITCLELRARLALALAAAAKEPRKRDSFLESARSDIRRLRNERIDYGTALALRLQAIEAWIANRMEDARGLVFLAESTFDACDMGLHANVMKRFRGMLKGPSGQNLVREAEEWMRRQGVASPSRMMTMYLPGMTLEPNPDEEVR